MSRTAWAIALAALVVSIFWWLTRKPAETVSEERERFDIGTNGQAADPELVLEAIGRANAECLAALQAGDAYAYAQHFTDDSISLPGRGPMVRGRAAIEEAMEQAFGKVRFTDAEWQTLETRFNGKTAYEAGAYRFVMRPSGRGRAQKQAGRYFVVWKKVGDEWKIAVDAAQPGAPPE